MKRAELVIWTLLLIMIPSCAAIADNFKLTPSVSVREEYTDNLFFSTSDEVDDYITTIFGGLDLLNMSNWVSNSFN